MPCSGPVRRRKPEAKTCHLEGEAPRIGERCDAGPTLAKRVSAATGCSTPAPAPPHRPHNVAGDRQFESISLQRRVRCEPDFLSRVDHAGEVLDVLVQRRRDDSRAALRLMRKLLKEQGFAPRLLVADKLRSYASAFRRLRLTCPHAPEANRFQPVRLWP
jgi:DDE domain